MFLPLVLLALVHYVTAQTATVVNPAGQTVVQVITLGVDGLPSTSILQTLVGAADPDTTSPSTPTTTAATTTTTLPLQQGPVGQPAPTLGTPGGPTPFTYTTTIGGETIVTTDVFTPTTPATTPHTPTAQGTIWDYSQWLSQYAAAQSTGSSGNSATPTTVNGWMVLTVVACMSLGFTLPLKNALFAL
ncbi:hypothetical protein PC9H_009611 [Pleurotus ostreatus]|uniref:Uncharacterized protein n=2 Tax=Pleurotus TaxID=5320 RepID=A0A8H6ZPQ5_PLEOS|nr:uncharacterized protein PC9H_009611 [Pleurotus ostreatus]KAF7424304.1 hypothetical protein PC9H_009611 [Pleurotus ostreatus]KAG9224758.1 hypothetical protein CCMSSC00406_0002091 [Pleurotus cornucopiae]KAJ8692794.1 hypothetical protein PTI98_010072 [Pleurotus ostreatus]